MRIGLIGLAAAVAIAAPACKKDTEQKPATATDDAAAAATDTDKADDDQAEASKLVEHGKYVADMMGCVGCHTPFGPNGPDLDKAWAGGLEVPEKFGTWRSPNITQDEATGIGTWTDQQIIDAVREGMRPDGERMFPIMPYPHYNVMSDDDAKALVAFLRTIEPISNKVERVHDLKIKPVEVPPAKGEKPNVDDPVAYGEYVASLMHCEMCHTPMTPKGPDMSKRYAGGFPFELPMMGEGVVYSSNITPDEETGIGTWTDEDIATAIREMKSKDGSVILPPMAIYQSMWYGLKDEEVNAVAAYLKSIPAVKNKVPENTFKPKGPPPGAGGDGPPPGGEEAGDEEATEGDQ